jgi:hypothetical protein
VFENRVLRRIFGPKRDEVTGGCIMRSQEERDHWENQDVWGLTISKWILEI